MLEANWQVYVPVVVIVMLLAVWLLRRATKGPREREYQPDVLDEGQGPAQRNQALIDAKPAADVVLPPAMSSALGGAGEVVAVGAQDLVEEAEARAAEPEVAPPPPPPAPPPPPVEVPQPEPEEAPELETEPELPVQVQPDPLPTQQPEPEPEPAQPENASEPASEPEPAATPASEAVPLSTGGADDLGRIKGLGPKLQTLLPTLGISTFAQIAALTDADLADLDTKLGPFAGRPARDGWVEQAKYLAAGDVAGFEARFGKV